jgi:hypothetical protein
LLFSLSNISIKSGEISRNASSSARVTKEDTDFFRAWQKLDAKFFNSTYKVVHTSQMRPSEYERANGRTYQNFELRNKHIIMKAEHAL